MKKFLITASLLLPLSLFALISLPLHAEDKPAKAGGETPKEKKADAIPAHKQSRAGKNPDSLLDMGLGDGIVVHSDISYIMELPKAPEEKKEVPTTGKDGDGKADAEPDEIKAGDGEAKTADDDRRKLDLYLPKDKKDFPVFIFVHGGSWTNEMGDKRHGKSIATGLCEHGIGVVSIGYRAVSMMEPQKSQRFPTFVEDVAMGVAWVQKNIKTYGGDASKMVIGGHSAGGQIGGLIAYDSSYLKTWNLENDKLFKGFVSISGACIIPSVEYEDQQVAMFAPMFDGAFDQDKETRDRASVTIHVGKGESPALAVYAERDFPHFDTIAKLMGTACKAVDVTCTTDVIAGRNHVSILQEFGTINDKTTELVSNFCKEAFGMNAKADAKDEKKDPKSDDKKEEKPTKATSKD